VPGRAPRGWRGATRRRRSSSTDWIGDLAARGIAAGCGGGAYCPSVAVSRGQMAALLSNAFALP